VREGGRERKGGRAWSCLVKDGQDE